MTPVQKYTYLQVGNAHFIDEIFEAYSQDPHSVDASWRYFFEGLELGTELPPAPQAAPAAASTVSSTASVDLLAEAKVAELILAYRTRGARSANLDPLSAPGTGASPKAEAPKDPGLELAAFGLASTPATQTFHAAKLLGMGGPATLAQIVETLKATYCGTIGVEAMHIQDATARQWLLQKIDAARGQFAPDAAVRKRIFKRLAQTEGLERFLHTRYVAQKRFSVEGGDNALPILDTLIERGSELGAEEFRIGMAHRGRLNVLVHTMGKPYAQLFTEFEGTYKSDPAHGEGDVKYHKGASKDLTTAAGRKVHLSLAFNPSHLEFVNPVVEGATRARQDQLRDTARSKVVPVLIHGDAAFAGQGVCFETLQMMNLPSYGTGGTLHLVINNQVGFTTPYTDSRSTPWSTDLAKVVDGPVLHVNGDDADACWFAAQLAIEWRQKFKTDFFIDLICYRKHGHNEGDEPTFTQPVMYGKIKTQPSPREVFQKKLTAAGVLSEAEAQAVQDAILGEMTEAQKLAKATPQQPHVSVFEGQWKPYRTPKDADLFAPSGTEVPAEKLLALAEKINTLPADFKLHPKLGRFFEARLKAVRDGKGIDWGNGEALAYASLVAEGSRVRISGQDAERGTFTHRHAVLNDSETGRKLTPLHSVCQEGDSSLFQVYNSHLSETAAMGFEFGYALSAPEALTVWEAQFGDFANGAQVIIDQFLATTESKWQRMNALTLLLPHGYEGQGPEHSSARLERFLALCGKNNMTVVNLTTPAQIFHALRRQVLRPFRRPLVVMSPKSMLRHPQAISNLDELTRAGFQEVIDCPEATTAPEKVRRVILCSGKVYYDLVAERTARKLGDVAIVRVEQLYPWPAARLEALLKRYSKASEFVWAQEEPRNMGAWTYVFSVWSGGLDDFGTRTVGKPLRYAGRAVAASPAVGSPKVHEAELKAFLEQAFT